MSDDWLLQNADQVLSRQRGQVDTVKVVLTLTVGVAATLVGTALQVDPITTADRVSVGFLFASLVATLFAIALDRIREPDRKYVERQGERQNWNDRKKALLMRCMTSTSESVNARQVRAVQCAAAGQVVLAFATSAIAVVSLLTDA